MTRTDTVRAATGTAKESVRHAAEMVGPYAGAAKENAAHYAHQARVRLGPKVSHAAHRAQDATAAFYHGPVARQVEHARGALPPRVDAVACKAAARTREAARHAADYTTPRVEHAMATTRAALPGREEAAARGAAAMAALRGQVSAADITRLTKQRARRARGRRAVKRVTVVGLMAGGALAAWKWWDKQAHPDWLVEPPAATELDDRATLASVDGSGPAGQGGEAPPKPAEAGDAAAENEQKKKSGD